MMGQWDCPLCNQRMTLHCTIPVKDWAKRCRWLRCTGCRLLRNIMTGRVCADRERQEVK